MATYDRIALVPNNFDVVGSIADYAPNSQIIASKIGNSNVYQATINGPLAKSIRGYKKVELDMIKFDNIIKLINPNEGLESKFNLFIRANGDTTNNRDLLYNWAHENFISHDRPPRVIRTLLYFHMNSSKKNLDSFIEGINKSITSNPNMYMLRRF